MNNWDEILSQYMDGELPQDERAHVEAQLESCELLRAKYANMQSIKTALQQLPNEELPFGLQAKMLRVARLQRRRKAIYALSSFGTAAAAVLVVVFAFVLNNTGVIEDYAEPQIAAAGFVGETAPDTEVAEIASFALDVAAEWDLDDDAAFVEYAQDEADIFLEYVELDSEAGTPEAAAAPQGRAIVGTDSYYDIMTVFHRFVDEFDIDTFAAHFSGIYMHALHIEETDRGIEIRMTINAEDYIVVFNLISTKFASPFPSAENRYTAVTIFLEKVD